MSQKGYNIQPVNLNQAFINGVKTAPNLRSLKQKPQGVLIVLPPSETEKVVRESIELGIGHIWMQQGAESETAVNCCLENGVMPVSGECILMYARPVTSIHKFHRWIWKLLGKIKN